MSTVAVAAATAALGAYSAYNANKASKRSAAAQDRATQRLTESADYAADLSYKLGSREQDFAERVYAESIPIRDRVVGLMLDSQQEQMDQARDYYDYMRGTFRPLERGLVADATAFDTAANRDAIAAEAAQRAALAFENSMGSLRRDMARRGVNPASGAFQLGSVPNAITSAALRATGGNQARQIASQLGWARKLDVAGLGRGLPGASSAAYAGAGGAGSGAIQGQLQPGIAGGQMLSGANNTMISGANMRTNAMAGILNNASYNAANAANNFYDVTGTLIGLGGTIAANKWGGS